MGQREAGHQSWAPPCPQVLGLRAQPKGDCEVLQSGRVRGHEGRKGSGHGKSGLCHCATGCQPSLGSRRVHKGHKVDKGLGRRGQQAGSWMGGASHGPHRGSTGRGEFREQRRGSPRLSWVGRGGDGLPGSPMSVCPSHAGRAPASQRLRTGTSKRSQTPSLSSRL